MDLAYIEEKNFFDAGFVRTIAMRFWKGTTLLNPIWIDLIDMAQNVTGNNGTNVTSLDDFPDAILPGEPIITLLQPEFEPGKRGISTTSYYSTMVEVRVNCLIYGQGDLIRTFLC